MIKGVILAGGTGSRLFPLTKACNKNLLPVGNEPMLYLPIKKMTEVGIFNICIVTSADAIAAVTKCLGSGIEIDSRLRLQYVIQDAPGGIAQAVGLARNFVGDNPFIVILGDNVFDESLLPVAEHFNKHPSKAMVYTYEVPDPKRFGVVQYDATGDTVEKIVEKPQVPPSNEIVTGVYAYPHIDKAGMSAFDYIEKLVPSARGELEITDLNNCYIPHSLRTHRMSGTWIDCGTMESLKVANLWAWSKV
jgi:glucose-1-phosphate thymidylyltransferase